MAYNQKLTPKQNKFIQEYAKTLNATEAARRAYDVSTDNGARAIASENFSKLAEPISQLLEAKGLTDDLLIENLIEGSKAEDIFIHKDKVYKKPEWNARFRYNELIAKLKRLVPNSKFEVQAQNADGSSITIKITEDTKTKEMVEGEVVEDEEVTSIA